MGTAGLVANRRGIGRDLAARAAVLMMRTANGLANRRFMSRIRYDPSAPAILLSAHLDDAVYSCWSVLTGQGALAVINVFAGLPRGGFVTTWDAICGARESRAQVQERIAEDADALALAGRVPLNLGFLDVQYRRARHRPPSWQELDTAVQAAVPAASALYAPLGARHPDHALLRRYASAMLGQTSVPLCLYADVPYATVLGWPHWVTGAAHDDRLDVDAEWAAWLPAVAELAHAGPARVVALGAGRSTRKLEAMRRYRTQFSALDAGGLRLLSNQAIHPFEVFWEVTSASPAHDRQGVRPAGHLAGRRARRHRSRTRSA